MHGGATPPLLHHHSSVSTLLNALRLNHTLRMRPSSAIVRFCHGIPNIRYYDWLIMEDKQHSGWCFKCSDARIFYFSCLLAYRKSLPPTANAKTEQIKNTQYVVAVAAARYHIATILGFIKIKYENVAARKSIIFLRIFFLFVFGYFGYDDQVHIYHNYYCHCSAWSVFFLYFVRLLQQTKPRRKPLTCLSLLQLPFCGNFIFMAVSILFTINFEVFVYWTKWQCIVLLVLRCSSNLCVRSVCVSMLGREIEKNIAYPTQYACSWTTVGCVGERISVPAAAADRSGLANRQSATSILLILKQERNAFSYICSHDTHRCTHSFVLMHCTALRIQSTRISHTLKSELNAKMLMQQTPKQGEHPKTNLFPAPFRLESCPFSRSHCTKLAYLRKLTAHSYTEYGERSPSTSSKAS